jgi:hypothetical protein
MLVHRRAGLRGWCGALVVTLLTGLVLVSPPSAAGAQRAATRLTVSVPSGGYSGQAVTVSGTLTRLRLAQPVSGAKVVVQRKSPQSSKWQTAGTAVTDEDGSYAVQVLVTRNTDFRAKFKQTRRLKGDISKVSKVLVTQEIDLTGHGPITVDAGEEVWLEGTASAGLRGTELVLEEWIGSQWKEAARASVASNGTFHVGSTTSSGGWEVPFRVRAPRTAQITETISESQVFTVYAWYPLSSMTPLQTPQEDAPSINFRVKASNAVAGASYPNSWAALYTYGGFSQHETGRAGFAPLTECSTLETRIGINDEAGANAAWQFLLYLDGEEYNYGYFSKGQTQKLTIPVTAVNKFRLVNHRRVGIPDDPSYAANAVWAGARIKCAGQP